MLNRPSKHSQDMRNSIEQLQQIHDQSPERSTMLTKSFEGKFLLSVNTANFNKR